MSSAHVNETAVRGFTKGSDAYERARPSYPPEMVDFLADELRLAPGATVVDVGAGTGKLTRLLVPTGARVIAVEPVEAMREKLAGLAPDAETLDGSAESLPLPDGSADAVTVAQAFHWFRHDEALTELARVLRPGGGLALIWNWRDTSVPWVRRLTEIIRWNKGQIPTYDAGDERWARLVAASGGFKSLHERTFRNDQEVDEASLLDRVASVSYIADMDDSQRHAVLDDVRALVAGFPERFVLPHVTHVHWCTRY